MMTPRAPRGIVSSMRRRLRSAARRRWIPWALFGWGLLTTAVAAGTAREALEREAALRLEQAAAAEQVRVEQRMEHFVTLLRGVAARFQTGEVDEETFRAYLARVRIEQFYPGIQGLGFAAYVPARECGELERRWQAREPRFRVWPATPFEDAAVIVMLEPRDERNAAAVGYDMMSEPTRREAMRRAVDEGHSRMTAPVTLVQEVTPDRQPGFLLYVPVYDAVGVPETREERWQKLRGFAYAAFRAGDLGSVLRAGLPGDIELTIHDITSGEPAPLFRPTRIAARQTESRVVAVSGRTWRLTFGTSAATPLGWLPPVVAGVGLAFSILLFWSTRGLTRAARREADLRSVAELERERAERAAELRERLVAIVSHDLRNPLGAISMAAKLLETQELSPRARAVVARIDRASNRMERMIEQLLDVARLRSGQRLTLTRSDVDLGELARAIIEEQRLTAPGRSIELETEGDLRAAADGDRLSQVLSNLVGNAVQHGAGAPVSVRLEGNGVIACSVHNEGAIPEAVRPALFEPFTRGDEQGSKRSLGLGLYISRELVRAHGGELEVDSSEEHGTTFRFRIPRTGSGASAVET